MLEQCGRAGVSLVFQDRNRWFVSWSEITTEKRDTAVVTSAQRRAWANDASDHDHERDRKKVKHKSISIPRLRFAVPTLS